MSEIDDTGLADFMAQAAATAKTGEYAVVVLGKVTETRAWPAKDGRPASTSCKTIVGEGETWTLRFPDGSAVPGRNHRGAFMVNDIYKGNSGISADVLGFA